MPFSPEGGYERSSQQEYIHQLISEFREQLNRGAYFIPPETDGVVVLSAPPEKRDDEFFEKTDENVARVEYAVHAIRDIVAKKIQVAPEGLTDADIIAHGPPLILNGETEQLPMMREVASELGFPEEKIQLVDAGRRGVANTKTQFTTMNQDPANADSHHWTFVSSGYHVPRVARTALTNLDKKRKFDVIGVPLKQFPYDVYRKIRGEVKRIVAYSAKGDIGK